LITLLVNLLVGSLAARYCLFHWLPTLHASVPAITPLDPATSIFSLQMILLGIIGGELFIPGAIITWLLISLGVVAL
jgi:hypothetical protein